MEFNLSSKIEKMGHAEFIQVRPIKEFIQRDKENFKLAKEGKISWVEYYFRKQKLAGDKLK